MRIISGDLSLAVKHLLDHQLVTVDLKSKQHKSIPGDHCGMHTETGMWVAYDGKTGNAVEVVPYMTYTTRPRNGVDTVQKSRILTPGRSEQKGSTRMLGVVDRLNSNGVHEATYRLPAKGDKARGIRCHFISRENGNSVPYSTIDLLAPSVFDTTPFDAMLRMMLQ